LTRVENQLRNIDFHRTDIDAACAHAAHPDPRCFGDFFIHTKGGHAQEFARVHAFQAGGRATRRARTAGQAQIEIAALGKQSLDLVDEGALFFAAKFDCLFSHLTKPPEVNTYFVNRFDISL
jgi:hypothetical protein